MSLNPFRQPEVAVVQHAEETAEQLVARGRKAEVNSTEANWIVGECASKFCAAGHGTDADFAKRIGSSRQRINECRRIYEDRWIVRSTGQLTWTHFVESLPWDDWQECLEWAAEYDASVFEMKAWRRAKNGEDLSGQPDSEDTTREKASNGSRIDRPAAEPQKEEPDPSVAGEPDTDVDAVGHATVRSPVRAKPEPQSQQQGSVESDESRKSEEASPLQSVNAIVMQIREAARAATTYLDSDEEVEEVVDELKRWQLVLKPDRFTPPTVEQVQEYCRIRKSPVDPEAFHAFYSSKGWLVGKVKMKNWKQAVITWERDRNGDKKRSGRVEVGDDDGPIETEIYS